MRAVYYEAFGERPRIEVLPDPSAPASGVVVRVEASGVCRSDWHGWMGHDKDIILPHVPGHELAGVVEEVGRDVKRWRKGDRITVPFVGGCGSCPECSSGDQQVCRNQFQPGFTAWGSFANYVAIDYADTNLVRIPEELDFEAAASLGCRFATSFRAIVDQGRVRAGEWVAIHGCGGVGLSAIIVAKALGARVIAIDISHQKLAYAKEIGADVTIDGHRQDLVGAIRDVSQGGAHVSIDALGSRLTCFNSISCLRRRGRHVQVGLLLGDHADPPVPMGLVIGYELEVIGSHGIQAHRYDAMFRLIEQHGVALRNLISRRIGLGQAPEAIMDLPLDVDPGMTVINNFKI